MYQQQELYRHQQEALARLQDEAERLRQEKLEAMGNGRDGRDGQRDLDGFCGDWSIECTSR